MNLWSALIMVRRVFAVYLPLMLLSGCNQTTANSPNGLNDSNQSIPASTQTIVVDDRRYDLTLPAGYSADKSYKLLLAFHGSGSNSRQMRTMSKFERYSDEYIVAYPKSKIEEWNEGCDCNKAHRLGVDDLGFVDKMLADINANYSITSGEVYAAGFSQGGLFVQNLLCHRSEVFKAIATVGAPMSLPLAQRCEISQPTSYVMIHGKGDRVLPYQGLSHPRFAMIGAEQAIETLAAKNQSLKTPLKKQVGVAQLTAFWNGKQKTQLYSIAKGKHRWSHSGFDTTKTVLDFFASAHKPELPEQSKLVEVDGTALHVRVMGKNHSDKPTVVLLSGPNKNFHADSAWFALLQNYLAKDYKVVAVDRPGNVFSGFAEQTDYLGFADKLHQVLVKLGEKHVVFAGFASANITLVEYERRYGHSEQVKLSGMLWIDPDVLLPYSIAFYQDYPVTFYRDKLAQLMPHLASGAWTERTLKKLEEEREQVKGLIATSFKKDMDWSYFDLASQQRLLTDRQQTRAIEIARYFTDLEAMKSFDYITSVPVSVIDSDFEAAQIEAFPDAAEKMTRWMEEGTQWSKMVAEKSGGAYIPLENAEHLVTFQHPQVIAEALSQLILN